MSVETSQKPKGASSGNFAFLQMLSLAIQDRVSKLPDDADGDSSSTIFPDEGLKDEFEKFLAGDVEKVEAKWSQKVDAEKAEANLESPSRVELGDDI